MNYQEAAIYLQVFMWRLLLIECTLLLPWSSQGYIMLSITPSSLEHLDTVGLLRLYLHYERLLRVMELR